MRNNDNTTMLEQAMDKHALKGDINDDSGAKLGITHENSQAANNSLHILYQHTGVDTFQQHSSGNVTNQYVENVVYEGDDSSEKSECDSDYSRLASDPANCTCLTNNEIDYRFLPNQLKNQCNFEGIFKDQHNHYSASDYNTKKLTSNRYFREAYVRYKVRKLGMEVMSNCILDSANCTITPLNLIDMCYKRIEDNYNFKMDNIITYVNNTLDQLKKISDGDYLPQSVKTKWQETLLNYGTPQFNKDIGKVNNNLVTVPPSSSLDVDSLIPMSFELSMNEIINVEVEIQSARRRLESCIYFQVPRLLQGTFENFNIIFSRKQKPSLKSFDSDQYKFKVKHKENRATFTITGSLISSTSDRFLSSEESSITLKEIDDPLICITSNDLKQLCSKENGISLAPPLCEALVCMGDNLSNSCRGIEIEANLCDCDHGDFNKLQINSKEEKHFNCESIKKMIENLIPSENCSKSSLQNNLVYKNDELISNNICMGELSIATNDGGNFIDFNNLDISSVKLTSEDELNLSNTKENELILNKKNVEEGAEVSLISKSINEIPFQLLDNLVPNNNSDQQLNTHLGSSSKQIISDETSFSSNTTININEVLEKISNSNIFEKHNMNLNAFCIDSLRFSMNQLNMQPCLIEDSNEDRSDSHIVECSEQTSMRNSASHSSSDQPSGNERKLLEIRDKREKKKMNVFKENISKTNKNVKPVIISAQPTATTSMTNISITNKSFYNSIYGISNSISNKSNKQKISSKVQFQSKDSVIKSKNNSIFEEPQKMSNFLDNIISDLNLKKIKANNKGEAKAEKIDLFDKCKKKCKADASSSNLSKFSAVPYTFQYGGSDSYVLPNENPVGPITYEYSSDSDSNESYTVGKNIDKTENELVSNPLSKSRESSVYRKLNYECNHKLNMVSNNNEITENNEKKKSHFDKKNTAKAQIKFKKSIDKVYNLMRQIDNTFKPTGIDKELKDSLKPGSLKKHSRTKPLDEKDMFQSTDYVKKIKRDRNVKMLKHLIESSDSSVSEKYGISTVDKDKNYIKPNMQIKNNSSNYQKRGMIENQRCGSELISKKKGEHKNIHKIIIEPIKNNPQKYNWPKELLIKEKTLDSKTGKKTRLRVDSNSFNETHLNLTLNPKKGSNQKNTVPKLNKQNIKISNNEEISNKNLVSTRYGSSNRKNNRNLRPQEINLKDEIKEARGEAVRGPSSSTKLYSPLSKKKLDLKNIRISKTDVDTCSDILCHNINSNNQRHAVPEIDNLGSFIQSENKSFAFESIDKVAADVGFSGKELDNKTKSPQQKTAEAQSYIMHQFEKNTTSKFSTYRENLKESHGITTETPIISPFKVDPSTSSDEDCDNSLSLMYDPRSNCSTISSHTEDVEIILNNIVKEPLEYSTKLQDLKTNFQENTSGISNCDDLTLNKILINKCSRGFITEKFNYFDKNKLCINCSPASISSLVQSRNGLLELNPNLLIEEDLGLYYMAKNIDRDKHCDTANLIFGTGTKYNKEFMQYKSISPLDTLFVTESKSVQLSYTDLVSNTCQTDDSLIEFGNYIGENQNTKSYSTVINEEKISYQTLINKLLISHEDNPPISSMHKRFRIPPIYQTSKLFPKNILILQAGDASSIMPPNINLEQLKSSCQHNLPSCNFKLPENIFLNTLYEENRTHFENCNFPQALNTVGYSFPFMSFLQSNCSRNSQNLHIFHQKHLLYTGVQYLSSVYFVCKRYEVARRDDIPENENQFEKNNSSIELQKNKKIETKSNHSFRPIDNLFRLLSEIKNISRGITHIVIKIGYQHMEFCPGSVKYMNTDYYLRIECNIIITYMTLHIANNSELKILEPYGSFYSLLVSDDGQLIATSSETNIAEPNNHLNVADSDTWGFSNRFRCNNRSYCISDYTQNLCTLFESSYDFFKETGKNILPKLQNVAYQGDFEKLDKQGACELSTEFCLNEKFDNMNEHILEITQQFHSDLSNNIMVMNQAIATQRVTISTSITDMIYGEGQAKFKKQMLITLYVLLVAAVFTILSSPIII